MKLETIDTGVETTLQGKQMGIEANTVLFNILSSKMYKNKIAAVIREISTNAIDAQIEAGVDKPIKVHLPTIITPNFIVRDYGAGLSPEDIEVLYTYGKSTKRESNLLNGALGLGSKSPFAYVQAFTTTSFYNGKKYTYSIYSDNGKPTVALLGVADTDEPSGIEVNVPVLSGDINKFEMYAGQVYKFFKNKVECNLQLPKSIYETKAEFEGKNWGIYKDVSTPSIVMANVAYPLDRLPAEVNDDCLNISGVVVFADIGEVQFAASREELEFTPKTIARLNKLNESIKKELFDVVDNELGDDPTFSAIITATTTLPGVAKSVLGDRYKGELYIGYGNTPSIDIRPYKYRLRKKNSWENKYVGTGRLTQSDVLGDTKFVCVDIKNRMKYVDEVETKKVIFVVSDIQKTKENAKSRFDKFIEKIGVPKNRIAFTSDYELPRKDKVSRKVNNVVSRRFVKCAYKYYYDKVSSSWKSNIITDDLEKNYATSDWFIIPKNSNTYLNKYGMSVHEYDGTPQAAFGKAPELFDKTKDYVFVEMTYNNYLKTEDKGGKFWAEVFPKSLTIYDSQPVLNMLRDLGLMPDYREYRDYSVITLSPKFEKYAPKDVLKLINKVNSTNTIKAYSKNIGIYFRYIEDVFNKDYTFIDDNKSISKLSKKYMPIIKTQPSFDSPNDTKAKLLKAYELSYNKLKKLEDA